jgi:hypothetical protein
MQALLSLPGVPRDVDCQERVTDMKPAEEYLPMSGMMGQDAALRRLAREAEKAKIAGQGALRLWVDMNWLGCRAGGMAVLLEGERLLGQGYLRDQSGLVACHYERVIFSSDATKLIRHSHTLLTDSFDSFSARPKRQLSPKSTKISVMQCVSRLGPDTQPILAPDITHNTLP